MIVHVRVNGSLAEALGTSRLTVTLTPTATVADLLRDLRAQHPDHARLVSQAVIVSGGEHLGPTSVLTDNQNIALLMPIAGG